MAKELRRGVTTLTISDENDLSEGKMELRSGKGGIFNKTERDSVKELFPGFYDPRSGDFNLRTFLYNPKEKTILGRTRKRWGICLLFYTCFYSCLAIFWGVMYSVHLNLVYKHKGPWIAPQDNAYFGPGLSYVPPLLMIDVITNPNMSIESLDKFLYGYQRLNAKIYKDCRITPSSPENCFFDVTTLGECAPGGTYGYYEQKPCIILKFNRAYAMKFEPYNKNDELPSLMPADLKDYVRSFNQSMNRLWLSCEGHKDKDKASLDKISYFPDRSFENYYYPYFGHSKHLSPLVAIKVSVKKRGVIIRISCQLWAKNLSTDEMHGSNAIVTLNFQ